MIEFLERLSTIARSNVHLVNSANDRSVPPPVSSGLYYYGYRFYSPNLGRWISRDPIREQGGRNLYNFVGNNGVDSVDLFGLTSEKCHAISETAGIEVYDLVGISGSVSVTGKWCECCERSKKKYSLEITAKAQVSVGVGIGGTITAYGSKIGIVFKGFQFRITDNSINFTKSCDGEDKFTLHVGAGIDLGLEIAAGSVFGASVSGGGIADFGIDIEFANRKWDSYFVSETKISGELKVFLTAFSYTKSISIEKNTSKFHIKSGTY